MSGTTSRDESWRRYTTGKSIAYPSTSGAMRSSGIQAIAYNRLKAHLGIEDGQTLLYDIMQQLAQPETSIVNRFHLDALPLPPRRDRPRPHAAPSGSRGAFLTAPRRWSPTASSKYARTMAARYAMEAGHLIYHMPLDGLYYEPVYHPLAEATSIAEIEAWQPPAISDAELAWLAAEARRLRGETDKAIIGLTGDNVYEGASKRARLAAFHGRPGRAARAAAGDAATARRYSACANLARYLDAVGDFIDIIQMGDDLGTQNGPQISPRMYRRVFKPCQKLLYSSQGPSGLRLFLHSCGSIVDILPDLIEVGVEISTRCRPAPAAWTRLC